MVVCPDTYNVVDLNKLLVEKYKELSGSRPEEPKQKDTGGKKLPSTHKYDIHVTKLFAKHIKPEE